jgi:hypothetical protein
MPLPGQMLLPGMGAAADDETVSHVAEDLAGRGQDDDCRRSICPNCGGAKFDADGDCMSCWEPAVVEPSKRSGTMPPTAKQR